MKTFLPIFFSALIFFQGLLPGGNTKELNKVEGLITHYFFHQNENSSSSVGFIGFLIQHYLPFANHSHNANTHQDQLPFFSTLGFVNYFFSEVKTIVKVAEYVTVLDFGFTEPLYKYFCTHKYFQPPRSI